MQERQAGLEEFVIRLPDYEIQRRIGLTRTSLENLKREVDAFCSQPRNKEGQRWLASVERLIQQQIGLLTAYEDAQTLKWGESPNEQELRREKERELARLIREPWLSLTEERQWFLIGYRRGRWEISLG